MITFRSVAAAMLLCVFTRLVVAQELVRSHPDDSASKASSSIELINVEKIWSGENEWCSTDLIRYRGRWLCRLQGYPSDQGTPICILSSANEKEWDSIARFKLGNFSCSRFMVKDEAEVILFSGSQEGIPGSPQSKLQPVARSSRDGITWSPLKPNHRIDELITGVTRQGDQWWGVASGHWSRRGQLSLLKTVDGKAFTEIPTFTAGTGYEPTVGFGHHATIVFTSDEKRAYCLVQGRQLSEVLLPLAYLGVSDAPFTQWSWKKLDAWLLMPAMLKLPDDRLLVAGEQRKHRSNAESPIVTQLTLWQLNPETGDLKELLVLPSSGTHENAPAAPGLVWHEGHLWISYWSRDEQKTPRSDRVASSAVYLAKVKIEDAPATANETRQ